MLFGTDGMGVRLVPFSGRCWADRLRVGRAATAPRGGRGDRRGAVRASRRTSSATPAECKQYATDAAIAVGDVRRRGRAASRRTSGFRRWAVLAAAGAVAVWFSHPSRSCSAESARRCSSTRIAAKDRRRAGACAATIACWLASFGVCYSLRLRQLGNNQYLIDYWAGHFLPLPPKSLGDLRGSPTTSSGSSRYPGGLGGTEVRLGGIAAVLFAHRRRRRSRASAGRSRSPLVLPALLALLASGVAQVPVRGPAAAVPRAAHAAGRRPRGVGRRGRRCGRRSRSRPSCSSGCSSSHRRSRRTSAPPAAAARADHPGARDGPRRVAARATACTSTTARSRRSRSTPATTRSRPEWSSGAEHRDDRTGYRDELREARRRSRRVWLIFSHRAPGRGVAHPGLRRGDWDECRPGDPAARARPRSCSTSGAVEMSAPLRAVRVAPPADARPRTGPAPLDPLAGRPGMVK